MTKSEIWNQQDDCTCVIRTYNSHTPFVIYRRLEHFWRNLYVISQVLYKPKDHFNCHWLFLKDYFNFPKCLRHGNGSVFKKPQQKANRYLVLECTLHCPLHSDSVYPLLTVPKLTYFQSTTQMALMFGGLIHSHSLWDSSYVSVQHK